MPVQAVPQGALVQCMGVVDGQLTINDLSFVCSGAVTPTALNNLVAGVETWFTGSLAPLLSEDWSTTRVVGTDLSSLTGPRIEVPSVTAGGVTGEAAPNNVAACVSLRTDQRGRSARGRNFVPAIPNSVITLNTLSPTFITDLLSAYAELIGAGTFVAGWELCIISRVFEGLDRTPPITIPVTGLTMVGNSVRSMRSREIGHGA